jgi:hypothetical protein
VIDHDAAFRHHLLELGQGNVRGMYTTSPNGKIDRNVRVEGEYVVNADCTSTVSYSDGTHYDQFLAPDGKTFVFVQTNESSPKWIAAAQPGRIPHFPIHVSPGSSRTTASPVRNAFGGQVIGSTARLRRVTSGSGSPVKTWR